MSNEIDSRSVYVGGFTNNPSEDSIAAEFSQYGDINNVRKRMDKKTGEFKGSLFLEFKLQSKAKKFAALKNVKYNDVDLTVQSKTDFIEGANQKLREAGEKKHIEVAKSNIQSALKGLEYSEGTLVHVKDIGGEKVTTSFLSTIFKEFHSEFILYPYNSNHSEAVIRFATPAASKQAVDTLKTRNLTIGGNKVTLGLLEGEKAKSLYEKMIADKAQLASARKRRANKKRASKPKNSEDDKQNATGDLKRKNETKDDEHPKKKSKT
ncbi:La-like protein [Acrasis kona]|uniref:La-like protein n=1 Tax=Acrasis kona TaxID=1008807 RepID=A0AAW2Z6F3_9EUKA